MATHTVAAGAVGTAAFVLTADAVDTVTFTGVDLDQVSVISDGAAAVWYTLDGSTPEVDGEGSWYIPAIASVATTPPPTAGSTVVKLVSEGTPLLRVQRGS